MDNLAISLKDVSKFYKLYDSPRQRLVEALHPFGKKYHKEFYAIKDVTVDVKKGEILGIIGKNGSGKSTLLKLITRVLVPSHGTVVAQGSISALIELGAGFNPQFTGLDNIFFYGTILGFSKEEMESKVEGIIEFADIGEFIHQPIKTYSSGMKARLAFAVATEVDPDILIIDEVLAVGDTVFQRKCFSKINNLFDAGKTVILVSHSRNSIIGLCQNAILLDKGQVICSGKAEPVVKEYEKLCYKKFLVNSSSKKNQQNKKKQNTPETSKNSTENSPPTDEITWDPTLIGDDLINYKKSDIEFADFAIHDLNGNKVNVLKSGQTYKVTATFLPKEDITEDVMYAMRFRTLQGYMIAWMGYPFKKKEYLKVEKDTPLVIEYLFDCNFHKGVFCVDAGLQSIINNELFLHSSINNVYTFRLNEDSSINLNGDAYLDFRAT